jgi:radical SAM-linked protein
MYHYLLTFSKRGDLRFISHLDLLRTFIRSARRAGIPTACSKGYNPQPKFVFAAPLAVGIEGENEYLDLYLKEPWETDRISESLNMQFPDGLKVHKIRQVDLNRPPLSAMVGAALYKVFLSNVTPALEEALLDILSAETILIERKSKKDTKTINIRPYIYLLSMKKCETEKGVLFMLLATGNKGGTRPQEIMSLLPLGNSGGRIKTKIFRKDLFVMVNSQLKTPEGLTPSEYLE